MLQDEGRQVVETIRAAGGEAAFMHLDVTDEANWKSVVDAAVATLR